MLASIPTVWSICMSDLSNWSFKMGMSLCTIVFASSAGALSASVRVI